MSGDDGLIDLTGSPDASLMQLPRRRHRSQMAAVDVNCSAKPESDTIDLSRPEQEDEAGPSGYTQPATLEQAETSGAAEEAVAPQVGCSTGSRKRAPPAERVRQAEEKRQKTEVRRAEARAQKAEAKANKQAKAAAEQKQKQVQQKRVDQYGKTVRYSSNAPQQTKERMARAMPGMAAT